VVELKPTIRHKTPVYVEYCFGHENFLALLAVILGGAIMRTTPFLVMRIKETFSMLKLELKPIV